MATAVSQANPLLNRLHQHAARAAKTASGWMESHPLASFALLSVFYFAAVISMSSVKLLWLDELITLHIARLNSAHAIWTALASGADPNPPLTHLAVMWCRRLFGEHAWALRLPATIGYWIGMLTLFLFLKRRLPAAWALAGTVLSMGMGGFEWAYESRSYAIFYGFAMLAFYCWMRTADGGSTPARRWAALAGMTLALAGGICTNYFAVLAFVPVAAAEVTRTFVDMRFNPRRLRATSPGDIRWSVWLAMGVAISPMLIFRPMIKSSIALYAGYAWNKVSVVGAVHGYTDMVDWMRYPLFFLMFFALTVHLLRRLDVVSRERLEPRWLGRLASTRPQEYPLLSLPEAAGVAMLIAYPFLGFMLATLRGGMLSPRFVIPVCLGAAIAGILFAYRTFGHMRGAGTVVLALALCWFGLREAYSGWVYDVRKQSFDRLIAHIPPPEYPGQPLVVSDDVMLLPLEFYATRDVVQRIVCPIDFPAIMRDRGEASAEVNLWAGRGTVYKFPIVPLAKLQENTSTYVILTSGQEWLVEDLLRHWYEVEPMMIDTQSADTYDFFSPITHARPVFFRAAGDLYPRPYSFPLPISMDDNLPRNN